jgi:NAD-dependent deacetylase
VAAPAEKFPVELIDILRGSRSLAVLTGAGISAESGVPTFRQAQTGLWAQFDPLQLATPQAFHNNPKLIWDWYSWRRELISESQPNPGHIALVDLENHYPEFSLVTQNVDGLHQMAGSTQVIELHGNIFRTKCPRENKLISDEFQTTEIPPRCPHCEAYLRPDVVWFGESLPEAELDQALGAASTCQAFISIGTSSLVEPAASLPLIALSNGATVLEINPQTTPLTPMASYSVQGNAGDVLPILAAQVINS